MPLSPRWRFTESLVGDAPEFKGIYVLWANDVPLAVGHAAGQPDTIRSRLCAHLAHGGRPGMARITHYSWEICSDPLRREREVTRELGIGAPSHAHQFPTPEQERWPAPEQPASSS